MMNKLIKNLSWDLPEKIQKKAIKQLMDIDQDQVSFLIKNSSKECWHNAVEIIKNIGFPRNKNAISDLIWLLKDFNWPGSRKAFKILEGLNKNIIIQYIENALKIAKIEEDYIWIAGISHLIKKLEIVEKDFENKENFKILDLAEW